MTGQLWDEELVEVVAKAIHHAQNPNVLWEYEAEFLKEEDRRTARAVLAALKAEGLSTKEQV